MEAVPFKKGEGKGLYNHVGNMLSCIKSRELPNADVAIGARVAKMAHLANISCRVQREVHWDDKNNLFVGDNEATALSKAITGHLGNYLNCNNRSITLKF